MKNNVDITSLMFEESIGNIADSLTNMCHLAFNYLTANPDDIEIFLTDILVIRVSLKTIFDSFILLAEDKLGKEYVDKIINMYEGD